jgi:hypothetical protein
MSVIANAPGAAPRPWHAILVGGGIAATLDMTAACVQGYALRGRSPVFIAQSIASGILGDKAWSSGLPGAALGLFAHYFIIFVAAALLWWASRRIRFIVDRPLLAGPLYGAMIFAFMNLVVVPLSAAPFTLTYTPVSFALQLAFHLFLVGLPLALATRAYSR